MANASDSPEITIAPTQAQRRSASSPIPSTMLAAINATPRPREIHHATVSGGGSGIWAATWSHSRSAPRRNPASCPTRKAARSSWIAARMTTPSGRRSAGTGTGASFSVIRRTLPNGCRPSRAQDGDRARVHARLEPVSAMGVAVDLDRLRRIGDDPDATGPKAQVVTARPRRARREQRLRRAGEATGESRGRHDEHVEEAVGRVDGLARPDEPGHDLAAVR